jgi:hypothetical protein
LKPDIVLFFRFREKDQKALEFSDRPVELPFLQEDLGYPELDRFGHYQDSVSGSEQGGPQKQKGTSQTD